jgi:MFS family permease
MGPDGADQAAVRVAGLFLFSASSLVCGLATAPEVLVAARVAQSMGAAMLAPATLAVSRR